MHFELRPSTITLVVSALAASVLAWRFFHWRRRLALKLERHSQVIQTACGPMEFATSGDGGPILVIHGAMGGYDQGLAIAEPLTQGKFKLIAVSRPGYLRTPLATGRSYAEQSDAYAAVLDSLGLHRVAIIGISAGGSSALQFACRYPDRCSALVLLSAATRPLTVLHDYWTTPIRLLFAVADLAPWLFLAILRWKPLLRLSWWLSSEEINQLGHPARMANLVALNETLFPLGLRWQGLRNDGQVRTLRDCPLEKIQVPVLVIHGDQDTIVPLSHAEHAAQRIPAAKLIVVPGGSHVVWAVRFDSLAPLVTEFLRSPAST